MPPMALSPFVQLRDPDAYRACQLDLVADDVSRRYWIDFFASHIDTILGIGLKADPSPDAKQRAAAVAADLRKVLASFDANPHDIGPVTLFTMDRWRDEALERHGFPDAFADQKRRENELMLPLLPGVFEELDASADPVRLAIEGVFAGNIFDMGAGATAGRFKDASPDFHDTRDKLKPRPWRYDDLDAFAASLATRWPKKVVFFADNAGSDFVLGVVPFCRLMAQRGASVVIAANEDPSLNDMTANECRDLWPRLGLSGLDISVVSTGTGDPLIDLSAVSDELNAAASDADLVVMEGMGRGIESNFDADFQCDRLNLAMLKDANIAGHVGGEVYDCVCRFVPAL